MLGQEVLVDNHYCYDRNDNCTERQQPGGTTRYTYDSVNQLTQIEYPTYTEQFYYDKAGNRSRRITDGTQEEYRYDPANHLTEYTRGGEAKTFTYDKAGNLTADDRARYTYDLFNRTEKVETFDGHIQINHYDAEGLRSGIEEDGRLVQFIFRSQEVVTQLEEEKGMTRYIRGYDLIASDADCARTYYHYASDELGSITHVVAGEDILNRYEYDAWGNLTFCEEKVENRFKFNGQQYDPISQQYYLRARYYNPVIGRFTQEDTYRGDGLNLYAYCRNNPVYYADPSGHMSKCMRDALQRVMERDGITQEQMDNDPDLRLRLMADASNIVKEQKRQQREQGNNSQGSEVPALPGPGPTLALPGPVLDTSDNRLSNSEADGPDNNSRQSGESGSNATSTQLSRRELAERKLADAARGSQAEGVLIGKDGDVPVYQSQQQLKKSITDAGAQYVGPTRNNDGQIYHMNTPYGPVEIRIMQQKPGQTNPYLDNRTIIVEQGSVGNGTGVYTYGNGAPIRGSVSRNDRKAIGHTHGQTP